MANTKKNEQYVTELASPDDCWLSVTDAARITRRQEKSIRDWVESGKLPVNPERTGLNKRTRLIRLSDLATLTPMRVSRLMWDCWIFRAFLKLNSI